MADAKLERILQEVKPKTFFEDLAEFGYLVKYLHEFMKEKYETDKDFRLRMYNIMYKHSKYPVQEMNLYYLEHLENVMSQFIKKTEVENA